MISDKQRREVARKLRSLAGVPADIGITEHEVIRTLGISSGFYDDCCRNEDVLSLADLIDRPTCKNFGLEEGTNGEGYDFFCSRCGFAADVTDPKYCPECGTEVV